MEGSTDKTVPGQTARSPRARYDGNLCTCADCEPIETEIQNMQILFIGKAVGKPVPVEDGLVATPFEISECLIGDMPKRISIMHPESSQACGYRFKVGKRILWSAYYGEQQAKQSEEYYTDGCAKPCYKEADYREILSRREQG